MKEVMSSQQIQDGLKHYRRIARQDLLRAPETPDPEAFRVHAEARRAVYADLTNKSEEVGPDEVLDYAIELYRTLPFVTGTPENTHSEIRGQENALENFFLMVGLDPKRRREARASRPKLESV